MTTDALRLALRRWALEPGEPGRAAVEVAADEALGRLEASNRHLRSQWTGVLATTLFMTRGYETLDSAVAAAERLVSAALREFKGAAQR